MSVRNAEEAGAAVAAGAHWIDVKEPARGALGAATRPTWAAVQAVVADRCPMSVALGELMAGGAAEGAGLPPGFRFAKIGLAACVLQSDWALRWIRAVQTLPGGTSAVAVAYADYPLASAPSPAEVLRVGRDAGCAALLVDTFSKQRGRLFDHLSALQLRPLLETARAQGWVVVIGGSLDEQCLEAAVQLQPDYLAVRGAVCRGGRAGGLEPALVRRWVERLAGRGAAAGTLPGQLRFA